MTRKHFESFAKKIKQEVERLQAAGFDPGRQPAAFLQVKRMAEMIGEVCIEHSERFDYNRFIEACDLPDIDAEKAVADLMDTKFAP